MTPTNPTPPPPPAAKPPEVVALEKAKRGLKLVCASLPHLAGLAHTVRLRVYKRFPVAAISSTGLLLINPKVFAEAPMGDVVFVLAHELLHLALDTFGRQGNADPKTVNVAHDYIINDILTAELGRPVPLNGLRRDGARHQSLEALVAELSQQGGNDQSCWSIGRKPRPTKQKGRSKAGKSKLQEELEKAGLLPPEPEPEAEPPPEDEEFDDPGGDLVPDQLEAELEPEVTSSDRQKLRDKVRREAAKAVSLQELRKQSQEATEGSGGQGDSDAGEAFMDAIQTAYTPPWQLALQHWLDAVAPGPRSYARPSRRSGDRSDIILPGRTREGWALHVVLDTSGSMVDTLPHILGLLASFCEACSVNEIHVLQCDVGVTADEWLDPSQLQQYKITGFGGSDMSPGLNKLSEDPEVAAVLVLTDGYIDYPQAEPHYAVLWGLVDGTPDFTPPYGTVVHVRT